ncbi:MAG: radical SAM protein, partial [Bacteroidales bacterium]
DFRLRLSSIEPDGFGAGFYDLLKHPKFTPHLHLCLQSGSENILRKMKRMYTVKSYLTLVESIRSAIPDFNFTTDIMVGFPGETEEDFRDTCRVIEQIGFSHIHTFKYSIREGTRAGKMEDQIPYNIKSARSKIIRKLSDQYNLAYRSSFIGKTQRVLIEKALEYGGTGYGQHYIPVFVEGENLERNTYRDCSITGIRKGEEPILTGTDLNISNASNA